MSIEPERSLLTLASISRIVTVRGVKSQRTARIIRNLPNHLLNDIGFVRSADGVLTPI